MRILILTLVTVFSMEAFAGPFLFSEKKNTPVAQLTRVDSVELNYPVSGGMGAIIVKSAGKECHLYNREYKSENMAELVAIHQSLLAALKNHNTKDGTITILTCSEKKYMNSEFSLITEASKVD